MPQFSRHFAHRINVGPGFHKRLADSIHAVFQGEFEAVPVVIGKCADAQVDAGQVEALAGAQHAAYQHFAVHLGIGDRHHFQLNVAVVEKQGVAGSNGPGQALKADGNPLDVTGDFFSGQGKRTVGFQLDGFFGKTADAHFGTRQVRHDRHFFAGGVGHLPNFSDGFFMTGKVTVGKVQPRHVHSG